MYSGKLNREVEQILKTSPSSDRSLKLDCVKLESLVKAYQLRRLEYVPGSCTHRPSLLPIPSDQVNLSDPEG